MHKMDHILYSERQPKLNNDNDNYNRFIYAKNKEAIYGERKGTTS